jgi:hypothetical protein
LLLVADTVQSRAYATRMVRKAWQRNGGESSGEIGPLLARALEADSRSRLLLSGNEFCATVDAMASAVTATGISALFGASVMGHALVGALVYRIPTARMWAPGSVEPVLLVDVVIASLQGLELAGEYATKLGATELAGLVVAVLGDEQAAGASFGPIMSISGALDIAA